MKIGLFCLTVLQEVGRARKHAEDGSTAANVQYDLVLEQMFVLVYRVAVRTRPDVIFLWYE